MGIYEIGVLGDCSDHEREILTSTLTAKLEAFDLMIGRDVMIRSGEDFSDRDTHAAISVAYFGGEKKSDLEKVREAFDNSLPIIPTVAENSDFGTQVPDFLHSSNGLYRKKDDPTLEGLASALLECVGLLREQRRVFVSYRRIESRTAAIQIHDLLSAKGFDVFLDTHDIRPGEPFQEVLWHRLCDSDVMVMLDTPGYFDSKWTRQEIGRARAKDIHILRVVWPNHCPNRHTDLADTIYLSSDQLKNEDGPLEDASVNVIINGVESLRSRSISSRYLSITGKFRAEVEKIGGQILGIGPHRAILVRLPDDMELSAFPVVGIPTADLLNDIADKAKQLSRKEVPILVYDHIGIRERWMNHLKWLDENIRSVKAIQVSDAGWTLAAWED